MRTSLHISLVLAVVSLIPAGLAACGGATSGNGGSAPGSAGEVVARVGTTPITRSQVSHWMASLAGADYFMASHSHVAPEGLVADPPNYAHCVASVEAAAAHSPIGRSRETGVQLLAKCRQLYEAMKIQAASYLVRALVETNVAHEAGVDVAEGEVQNAFSQRKANEFPTESALREYLARRREAVSDVLLETKLTLLGDRLYRKFGPAWLPAYNAASARWAAKTTCQPGYVVEYCSEYAGGEKYPTTPPPSVLMDQVTALVTGLCVDKVACAKQAGQ